MFGKVFIFRTLPVLLLGLSAPAAFLAPSVAAQDAAVSAAQHLDVTPLVIETKSGGAHRFRVEVARTPDQRRIGLMFRKEMAADHGMIFDYGVPQPAGMWMKNTFIPLDILFIQADGRIANIAHETTPQSLDSIRSKGRVLAVLELSGGITEKLGIAPGDMVRHELFDNSPDETP